MLSNVLFSDQLSAAEIKPSSLPGSSESFALVRATVAVKKHHGEERVYYLGYTSTTSVGTQIGQTPGGRS